MELNGLLQASGITCSPTGGSFGTISGILSQSGTNSPAQEDSISIISVSPQSAQAGVSTTFQVKVSYNLYTTGEGDLNLGFNTSAQTSYTIVADKIVSSGSGTHSFSVTVTLVDWGNQGDFNVYVNLAEWPHSTPYSPLVSTLKLITVN